MRHREFADEMLTALADDLEQRGDRAHAAIVRTAHRAIHSLERRLDYYMNASAEQAEAQDQ